MITGRRSNVNLRKSLSEIKQRSDRILESPPSNAAVVNLMSISRAATTGMATWLLCHSDHIVIHNIFKF